MKLLPHKKVKTFLWSTTKAALVFPNQQWGLWNDNAYVIAKSGDCCKIRSWVAVCKDGSPVSLHMFLNFSLLKRLLGFSYWACS